MGKVALAPPSDVSAMKVTALASPEDKSIAVAVAVAVAGAAVTRALNAPTVCMDVYRNVRANYIPWEIKGDELQAVHF
jgi:hypothetical protein